MNQEQKASESERLFRRWITWLAVGGTTAWAGYFFLFLAYQSLSPDASSTNWFVQMLQEHFAATIGVGISAVSAFCLVALLELYVGRVELEGMGFKFRGAAGPVFLWALCFVAMIWAVWLLWDLQCPPS